MKYLFSILALVLTMGAYAQPTPACGDPSIIVYADPILCSDDCAHLHALLNGETPINTGLTTDDRYTGIIPIGFTFNYYGTSYTNCVIGANGMINFDLSLAGSYCPWPISAALLGNTSAYNCICGPWCDIDPALGGTITYATSGTAPYRRFTATWCHTAMYNNSYCPGEWTTTQIILYEGCNYIDVQVGHKTACPAWNSGYAIIGIQNSTGTAATVAPGRDFPAVYPCTDEAWRFTPLGASYTVSSIGYAPVPDASMPINWYDVTAGGTPVGTGPDLGCATFGHDYRAEVQGCDFVSSTTYSVRTDTGTTSEQRIVVCVGETTSVPSIALPAGGVWTGGPPSIATLSPTPFPGTVTGVSAGIATYIYTYGEECTFILTVEVIDCHCVDTCYWTVSGNTIHSGNNIFGTVSNDDIRILTNNIDRAVWQAGGNLGIKQLSPSTTLDVDCVPTSAPSGLQFENLPAGHGNVLVVDPSGYVYVETGTYFRPSPGDIRTMQQQIDQLSQQVSTLQGQLRALGYTGTDASGNMLAATPNPTSGNINVSYTIAAKFSNASVKITDELGRLVTSLPVDGNTGQLSMSVPQSFASGNLVIALVVDGKVVATQKEVLLK